MNHLTLLKRFCIWFLKIKKNNRYYLVTGSRVDCTESTKDRIMVDYEPLDYKKGSGADRYTRELNEFMEKFEYSEKETEKYFDE